MTARSKSTGPPKKVPPVFPSWTVKWVKGAGDAAKMNVASAVVNVEPADTTRLPTEPKIVTVVTTTILIVLQ